MNIVIVSTDLLAQSRFKEIYALDIERQHRLIAIDLSSAVTTIARGVTDLVLLDGVSSLELCVDVCRSLRALTSTPAMVGVVMADDEATLNAFRVLGLRHFVHVGRPSATHPLQAWSYQALDPQPRAVQPAIEEVEDASSFDKITTLQGIL
jgi:DNA-binding NarL/FixJ family response regulator